MQLLLLEIIMAQFMKMLNNISRSQAIFRHAKISASDLQTSHYSLVLAICREPGRSQEELAWDLCVNKSTIARNLNYLEERGYITRSPLPNDKRQFSVHPTEKMLSVLPEIIDASVKWMTLLSEGVAQEDLDIFNAVLEHMESRAREIIENQEENK